jgi:GntR family transcriptional repressor for pyruvate dehydrogenase complex
MRDRVVGMLVDAIRSGAYQEGDKLPSERDLATQIGVSRAIVSDAIDALETDGVLKSRRGRGGGTFVLSVSKLPAGPQRIQGEKRELMACLIDAREAVEMAVVSGAARRARVTDLRELRRVYNEMITMVDDPEAYVEGTRRFNLKVAEASGNPFLVEFVRRLVNEQAALRREFTDPPTEAELDSSLQAHAAILDAIADGHSEQIRAAVARHFAVVRGIYLGSDRRSADSSGKSQPS